MGSGSTWGPGLIAAIMMIVTAMLTSLTIAREWERGTMEQLAATPVTRTEVVLGKLLPYVGIGLFDVVVCAALGVWLFDVPLRFVSARVCYTVSNAATVIASTTIRILSDSLVSNPFTDATDRNSLTFTCYTVTPTTPVALTGTLHLAFSLNFNSTAHTVRFTRVETTFAP